MSEAVQTTRTARPDASARRRCYRHAARRRASGSFAGSASLHAAAVVGLLLSSTAAVDEGDAGREVTIQLAQHTPRPEWREELEPPPELEPAELDDQPELVERELPPEPPPPVEPPPPPPDDRLELLDPLRGTTRMVAFRRPDPTPPVEVLAAAPPPAEPRQELAPPPPPDRGTQPEVVEGPSPRYPRASRRLGETGSVTLRAHVDTDGTVRDVVVVSSSAHPRLDAAARDAFLEWTFRPWQAGEPVERSYRKTFTFRMP